MTENKLIKIIALLIIIFFSHAVAGGGEAEGMEAVRKRRHPIVETAMALFSLPTTFPDTSAYWTKLDSLIQQGRAFFFSPPNLDFRQGTEDAPKAMEEGTGEKVKEAVVKSVDKSKATIEDSAKSAAKMAGETVGKATQKLKETLSTEYQDPPAKPDEL
nr:hypothetical protein DM860_014299 [Ipomoea batatas]